MLNRSFTANVLAAVMVILGAVAGIGNEVASAAPAVRVRPDTQLAQVLPDWMSADSAAQLDVGLDVLVPLSIPAPFSGAPQITASSGYYSLYWFVGGGSPTLLQITGTAGGSIPAYSKYDRNVELVPNATVNGVTAYHDVTPIYDLVYWQVGNVVYSVESQNASVDSITIANGLVLLAVPVSSVPLSGSLTSPDQVFAGDAANVNVDTNGEATLTTDVGYFTATGETSIIVSGSVTVEWQSPTLGDPVTATFQLVDPGTGGVIASTPTQILVDDTAELDWALECPAQGIEFESVTIIAQGPTRATLSASDGNFAGGSQAIIVNLGDSVEIEFEMPSLDVGFARLTLSDGESAVATCEISVVDEDGLEPTAEPTELPDGIFPGDGTDLSIPSGKEPRLPDDFATATPVPTRAPGDLEGDGTGIIEAALVTPPAVPPTVTPTSTPKPGEPTPSPVPTDTPAPTATPTPENPIPTMVPQVSDNGKLVALEIGPGGDTLTSPYGVQIQVPAETFSDVTSVSLQPVQDNQVPLQTSIRLVLDSAFEVSFAQMNGRTTDLGDKEATVLVDLGERWTDGATIYELVNGQAVELGGVSRDGTVLKFGISRPIRFVAGVPATAAVAGSRSLVPFIIIALISVILLIVAISVLTSLRSRRTPTVISRRPSGSRGRF